MSKILWERHAPQWPHLPPCLWGFDFEPPPLQISGYATVMVRQCLENKARTSTKFAASYTSCQLLHCSHRRRTVDVDDQPTCTTWSFRGIDVAHTRSAGRLCRDPTVWNSLHVDCRNAWTDCKQRCFSAHIEYDLVRDILMHRTQFSVKLRYKSHFDIWHFDSGPWYRRWPVPVTWREGLAPFTSAAALTIFLLLAYSQDSR